MVNIMLLLYLSMVRFGKIKGLTKKGAVQQYCTWFWLGERRETWHFRRRREDSLGLRGVDYVKISGKSITCEGARHKNKAHRKNA